MWDVFLIDQDFAIERPTRYYRQGLNLLHIDGEDSDDESIQTELHLELVTISRSEVCSSVCSRSEEREMQER